MWLDWALPSHSKSQQDARVLALLSAVLGLFSATRQKKKGGERKKRIHRLFWWEHGKLEGIQIHYLKFLMESNDIILVPTFIR